MKRVLLILLSVVGFSCNDGNTLFEKVPSDITGLDFINEVIETDSFHILNNEYMYNGAGVGVSDLNNDGLQDLIFTGNKVKPAIYLNQGEFKFKDITNQFTGLTSDKWISGIAIVDLNNDGFKDIYLTATNSDEKGLRRNELWMSQGIGEEGVPIFKEEAEKWGIDHDGYSVHAAFFDYDLDGDLDLYVLNNLLNESIRAVYKEKVVDGTALNNDRLFRNNGNGTFTDVTISAGIVYEGFGLGIAIGDVTKNGYPDLYISNDYVANDLLYINQGDGTFKNEISEFLSYQSKSSMGSDMADVNNDGLPDLITLDMFPEKYSRKKQTVNGNSYIYYVNDALYGYEHQYVRNMLHLHNGFINQDLLPFSEVGQISGVYQTEWSWSPLFADFDNDGDKDLIVTNGFPKDATDMDYSNYKSQVYGFVASARQVMSRMPRLEVSNYAFENKGELNFENTTKEWGMVEPSFSYGASFVDLDNDGDLDYVVNNLNKKCFVYRNTSESSDRHWLQIELVGGPDNVDAIGASVEVWAEGTYQFHEQYLSRGYISSVTPVIHFGLGSVNSIDSIKVTWPGGIKTSLLPSPTVDQKVRISINDATPAININPDKTYRFNKRSSDTTLYTHRQEDFIDFFFDQTLIPHKFSQFGPVMAKGDINKDGFDDILIGATDTLPTTLLIQRADSGFERVYIDGLTSSKIASEGDLALADLDNDGDLDVISVSGGFINDDINDYTHYVYYNEGDLFRREALDIPAFPSSVVRLADVDKDGDVDVFVGARHRKGMYPFADDSYILRNDNGVLNSVKEEGWKFPLGMVTDATFTDYNGDDLPDLVVAREWNSLAVLRNTGSGFDVPKMPALANKLGVWFSVTAGDFDGDGDEDLLAGNIGKNHRYLINDTYPMKLYAIDLDKNGVIDPFFTGYWRDDDGNYQEYPVNYLDELGSQSSYFRQVLKNYTQFSYSTADEILAEIPEEDKAFYYQLNTDASYILWNEGGEFTWDELPRSLQVSPITQTVVDDFNGDGNLDILLGGNDHTYDVSTGYFDANKGYLLLGQGENRSFRIQTPSETGILLQGQIGSLLQFKNKVQKFIVVGVNRSETQIYDYE